MEMKRVLEDAICTGPDIAMVALACKCGQPLSIAYWEGTWKVWCNGGGNFYCHRQAFHGPDLGRVIRKYIAHHQRPEAKQ